MANGEVSAGADGRQVKISCRNIWKVYGPNPEAYFEGGNGAVADPAGLGERMRAESHVVAASNVSFDVHVGEIFIIMGLSGSGKSTMVRCLSRLVEPTAGEVLLDDSDLLKASELELIEIRRHKMGMVFQNFGLLPHLTVIDNVAFPLKVQGKSKAERTKRAAEMVELVGLEGREDAFPRQLSGGQQGAVVPGRALLGARSLDPPADAGRIHAPAENAAQDHRLHHPRLPRSAAAGRPHRHHEGRRGRADGHAGGPRATAGGRLCG
jgi:glycine betaine/proline transport system ATP-binding protein